LRERRSASRQRGDGNPGRARTRKSQRGENTSLYDRLPGGVGAPAFGRAACPAAARCSNTSGRPIIRKMKATFLYLLRLKSRRAKYK
jgi:hypothetical protein